MKNNPTIMKQSYLSILLSLVLLMSAVAMPVEAKLKKSKKAAKIQQEQQEYYESCLYETEFKLFPMLMEMFSREGKYLTDMSAIVPALYDDDSHIAADILRQTKAEVFETENNIFLVYTFPYPPRMPLAKYGMMCLPRDKEVMPRYFTLEKTFNFGDATVDLWILGERTKDGHINYGIYPDCATPHDFWQSVVEEFYSGETLTPAAVQQL